MDRNTLYAINATGVPKPGYVLDAGKAPAKIKVRVYWQWENADEDYLNPQPVFSRATADDSRMVGTADVVMPWADYCAEVKAKRAALLAEADAAKQAEKDAMDELDARIDAVGELLDANKRSGSSYIDQSDMHWLARSGRIHDSRYSAMHVLKLVEAIVAQWAVQDSAVADGLQVLDEQLVALRNENAALRQERVVIPDEKG